MKKKILIFADSPGAAEFISPIIRFFKKAKDFEVLPVTVKDSPFKILQRFNPERCDKESLAKGIYEKFSPDILLCGTSSLELGPYVLKEFVRLFKDDGKRIIAFQDAWGNHRWPQNKELFKSFSEVIVPDKVAQELIKSDGYKGEIFITGNPAFEKLLRIDVKAERKKLRKKFNLSDSAFVAFYAGTGTPQSYKEDEATFEFFVRAFKEFRANYPDSALIVKAHPRDENPERYEKLTAGLKGFCGFYNELSEELLPVSDVVVAMYSTSLIHACLMRIPAVSILLPNAGMKRMNLIKMGDFALNKSGASIGIYRDSISDLLGVLNRLKTDEKFRSVILKKQKEIFPAKTISIAENTAKKILNIMKTPKAFL